MMIRGALNSTVGNKTLPAIDTPSLGVLTIGLFGVITYLRVECFFATLPSIVGVA